MFANLQKERKNYTLIHILRLIIQIVTHTPDLFLSPLEKFKPRLGDFFLVEILPIAI